MNSPQQTDWVQRIGDVFAILSASATLVFVSGGTVLISRLYVYKLAALEVVVGQIPQSILVTTGLVEVVAPCAGVAALYTIFRLIEAKSGKRWLLVGWPDHDWPRRFRWLALFFGLGLAVWIAMFGYWIVLRGGGCVQGCNGSWPWGFLKGSPSLLGRYQPWQFWTLALLANVGFIAMGFLVSARVAQQYEATWNSFRPVALMVVVWTLAVIPAFVTFDAGLPLADVRVCVSSGTGVYPVDGFLVAETADAVFVADGQFDESDPNATRRLITVPTSRVVQVISGGTPKQVACPSS